MANLNFKIFMQMYIRHLIMILTFQLSPLMDDMLITLYKFFILFLIAKIRIIVVKFHKFQLTIVIFHL